MWWRSPCSGNPGCRARRKRVSGSTGCNRFTGTFTQTGDSLRFSPLAT
ncbi:MAG: META domain-containing protein, partial [Deltaproteobacteria bacterium]